MSELINFLEEKTEIMDIQEIESDLDGYKLEGFSEDDELVEIYVTLTNRVYLDNEEIDLYLPLNVWAI